MATKLPKNIVKRWEGNPVISIRDLPFVASDVHNAGAIRYDGQYVLLVTVENLKGDCSIYCARSRDGRRFEISERPFLSPTTEGPFALYESHGVRDARITELEGVHYITYNAESEHGVRLALGRVIACEQVERIALISEPDTKNGVLFPRRIDGRYARLERPREGGSIWLSYSYDLIHWGGYQPVMTPRGGFWDSDRIGASISPIETPCGWLLIYYGERHLPGGPIFRLGAAMLDLDDPTQVRGRTDVPILAPHEHYERIGDVPNLVFSCGAVLSDDGRTLEVYYGAADSCICLGSVSMRELHRVCGCH